MGIPNPSLDIAERVAIRIDTRRTRLALGACAKVEAEGVVRGRESQVAKRSVFRRCAGVDPDLGAFAGREAVAVDTGGLDEDFGAPGVVAGEVVGCWAGDGSCFGVVGWRFGDGGCLMVDGCWRWRRLSHCVVLLLGFQVIQDLG